MRKNEKIEKWMLMFNNILRWEKNSFHLLYWINSNIYCIDPIWYLWVHLTLISIILEIRLDFFSKAASFQNQENPIILKVLIDFLGVNGGCTPILILVLGGYQGAFGPLEWGFAPFSPQKKPLSSPPPPFLFAPKPPNH